MVSQMGMESVSGFKNFLDALEEGNYEKAAQEMPDSRWGKQTPTIFIVVFSKKMSFQISSTISTSSVDFG